MVFKLKMNLDFRCRRRIEERRIDERRPSSSGRHEHKRKSMANIRRKRRQKDASGDVLSFVIDERDAVAAGEKVFSLKKHPGPTHPGPSPRRPTPTATQTPSNNAPRRIRHPTRPNADRCPLDCAGKPNCPLCTVKRYMKKSEVTT